MEEVLKAFISDQGVPALPESDLKLAEAVINATISGFLHLLREKNTHLLGEGWTSGECPFCGSFARIGMDYEDKRALSCLSCGHSWRFSRLKCPVCGNDDRETLGYFDAEGIDGVRVYFCRSCKHYIKVIDTRTRTVNDAETEDALTLEMDELARQEGFSPPA
jgi:FdhE protein